MSDATFAAAAPANDRHESRRNRIKRCSAAIACIVALVAAPLANARQDYRIELTKDTGDLDIDVDTFTGPAVTLKLENHSGHDAVCTAGFLKYRGRPSSDETMKTTIGAGKRATLGYPTAKLGGNFSTVFVDLKCVEKPGSKGAKQKNKSQDTY